MKLLSLASNSNEGRDYGMIYLTSYGHVSIDTEERAPAGGNANKEAQQRFREEIQTEFHYGTIKYND